MIQLIDEKFSIKNDRFVLNIIQNDDVENVFETMNDKTTADSVSFLSWPMTREQSLKWVQTSISGVKNQNEFLFIAKEGKKNLGCVGIHLKDKNSAEIGYWISKNYRGKGYATDIANAAKSFAFKDLKINKLFATAELENTASFRILEKLGFSYAGDLNVILPDKTKRASRLYELYK